MQTEGPCHSAAHKQTPKLKVRLLLYRLVPEFTFSVEKDQCTNRSSCFLLFEKHFFTEKEQKALAMIRLIILNAKFFVEFTQQFSTKEQKTEDKGARGLHLFHPDSSLAE